MWTGLLVSSAIAVCVSFLCSLFEAVLLSVTHSAVHAMRDRGGRSGKLLVQLKGDIDRPISAILILNTIAHTGGAAMAGAYAEKLFGTEGIIWTSVILTAAILFLSEILPKTLGSVYNRQLAPVIAWPLRIMVWGLYPLVWFSQVFTLTFLRRKPILRAPEEELRSMALLGLREGSILPLEEKLVRNVLALNDIPASKIMTPRTVVSFLPVGMTVQEAFGLQEVREHSRLPVCEGGDLDRVTGVVMSQEIYAEAAADRHSTPLGSLARPVYFVPETMPAHELLMTFIERHEHMVGVVDEFGGVSGIVTLEDVFEELIGQEIIDEFDAVRDKQELARRRQEERRRGLEQNPPSS